MSEPPPLSKGRLSLKINSGTPRAGSPATATPGLAGRSTMSPAPQTPSGGLPKIKLLSRPSQPPTPADPLPQPSSSTSASYFPRSTEAPPAANISALPKITTTKAGRRPKPTAKKRQRDESDDDSDVPLANGNGPLSKKTKITLKPLTPGGLSKQPTLKLKPVGKVPHRPLGEGYDSEAEDREVDPVIEEQFILRMMPGEHVDYLQDAIKNKKIGLPKSQGGADIQFKFLDEEGRRALWTIQGQCYAAILLDLPTITEGMKTWDKKSMVKSADLCQMMLVFAKVANEEEAKTVPLPKAVEHGHRWPHGITPPMHDARNRRFRKRLSKLEIQNKEAEVERLLAADREALSVRTEWVENRIESIEEEYEDEYEEDAEGEDDYDQPIEFDESALLAEFMDAPDTPAENLQDLATPNPAADAITPVTANTGTPAAQTEEEEMDGADEEESDEDEEDMDEEGDADDDDDGDEDRHDEKAGVRVEIAGLKKQLKSYEEQYAKSVQPLMRKRIEQFIRNIKSEIGLKMSAIGEVEED
ncbi:transcription initiation factor TFIID subunit 7 [Podospora australis]|uniref:Transcription initiation factor TFIID subunit 7 n=1 Tax=Podospora australis TaxID=1536484 RepID=A0AAN7AJ16_9PEZI|nr:transcription initiation factor TFIID subunit 7 [Podospora australis]